MSLSRGMDKYTLAHPDNGILFGNGKKCAIEPRKDPEEPEMHVKWKKSI